MPWFKVDDALAFHIKALSAGNQALGLWVRAGSWSMQQLSDGFVPASMVTALGGGQKDAKALIQAGLWHQVDGGFQFHDWDEYQPTREEVGVRRAKDIRRQALSHDPALRAAVKDRDGDNCRYCGVTVNWNDRKSSVGATYDHVDPDGPNSFDNLVVACRGCNAGKGARTPEQAGMRMIPIRSRSDLDMDPEKIKHPSRPVPSPDLTKTSKSQSRDNRASVSTDVSSITVKLAAQNGITDLGLVAATILEHTGRAVSLDEAWQVAHSILSKARRFPDAPMRYVTGAVAKSPFEVQQFIDTEVVA